MTYASTKCADGIFLRRCMQVLMDTLWVGVDVQAVNRAASALEQSDALETYQRALSTHSDAVTDAIGLYLTPVPTPIGSNFPVTGCCIWKMRTLF